MTRPPAPDPDRPHAAARTAAQPWMPWYAVTQPIVVTVCRTLHRMTVGCVEEVFDD